MKTKKILEILIPAIMEIEGGYFDNVMDFIDRANIDLAAAGLPYQFTATSKIEPAMGGETVRNVDTITVVDLVEDHGIHEGFVGIEE